MSAFDEEKKRKLSPAEEKRLARYEAVSEQLKEKGYERTELTVGIVKANVFAILLGLPVIAVGLLLFCLVNPDTEYKNIFSGRSLFIFLAAFIVLVVVHELIHGLTWGLFTEHHFKDIEFGFVKEYMTPYCACSCPLTKGKYIAGALMPLFILGIIPIAAAIAAGSWLLLWIGIVMVLSAGGDILLTFNILKHKNRSADVLYLDHPTQAGGVIFERI